MMDGAISTKFPKAVDNLCIAARRRTSSYVLCGGYVLVKMRSARGKSWPRRYNQDRTRKIIELQCSQVSVAWTVDKYNQATEKLVWAMSHKRRYAEFADESLCWLLNHRLSFLDIISHPAIEAIDLTADPWGWENTKNRPGSLQHCNCTRGTYNWIMLRVSRSYRWGQSATGNDFD